MYLRFKSRGNDFHRSSDRMLDRVGFFLVFFFLEGWLMRWRGYHLRERGNKTQAHPSFANNRSDRHGLKYLSLEKAKKKTRRGAKTPGTDPRSLKKKKKMGTRRIQKLFQTVSTDRQTHRVAFPATFLLLPSPQASPLTEEPTCQSF